MRKLIHEILLNLRQTKLRRPILGLLVKMHNFSYHMISFFSSYKGIHPKHAIMKYHDFFVHNVRPTDRVLDVGCGKGEVAYSVSQKAAVVVGLDISKKSIERAQKKYQRPNLTFIVGDALSKSFTEKYDAIVLSNVLEHIEHRVDFLKKLATIAPTILIRVPMITRDWISVYKKQEGFEYRLDDTHFIEFDRDTFRNELQQAGLKIDSLDVNFGELYAVVRLPST